MIESDAIHRLAERLLQMDADEMRPHERRVLERMAQRLAVSRDVNVEFDERLTLGARLSDRVAEVGGSWGFIIGFGIFIAVWVALNAIVIANAFDPYPFVFLNLLLSMVAALQAPIIMMSQNRQSAKDRLAASHDYEVNLKAEIEIAALHEKLDQLRGHDLVLILERIEATVGTLPSGVPAS